MRFKDLLVLVTQLLFQTWDADILIFPALLRFEIGMLFGSTEEFQLADKVTSG